MNFKCEKCGCESGVHQFRDVTVTLGWQRAKFQTIAPCMMCTQCGHPTVYFNITIGDFVNLVPASEVAKRDESTSARAKLHVVESDDGSSGLPSTSS